MNRALGLMCAAAVAGSAGVAGGGCGDDFEAPALTPEQVFVLLRRLPGVTVQEMPTDLPGYRHYVLQFTQPVDHDNPALGTFEQAVSLLHRDERAKVPLIIQTSGYADFNRGKPVELTRLLAANQVSIEHRYFGDSRPQPADWTKLTIKQMAADEHAVIEAMRSIYAGSFLTTGGSKGGMTAVFHRRFYPDDVDGTVAYVAPISFGAPDVRYAPFLDTIGPAACREAVRNAAVRMLSDDRDAMCSNAELQTGHDYTRVALRPAVEAAIVGLEWTFWQYSGVKRCPDVPGSEATVEELFAFLDDVSPPSDYDDKKVAEFEAYYYQSYAELGYPDAGTNYLTPFLWFGEEDYAGELPVPEEPEYDDGVAMRDISEWVEDHGSRLLFIYGQWDPWTKGKFPLGNAALRDSHMLIVPEGTHMARIQYLELADRELALSRIEEWTGATPMISRLSLPVRDSIESERKELRTTRMPPALARALTVRK
jgi:hypothetical protein